MSAVTGPISSLPGSGHSVPEGQMCDYHPDQPAVARIQGETDSFGCEMDDICQACLDAHKAYRCSEAGKAEAAAERTGVCDWCKNPATDLRNRRDFEEGMCGPVYRVCGPCVQKENERIAAELAEMDERWGPLDDGEDYYDD